MRVSSRRNSIMKKLTLFLTLMLALQCLLFAGFILLGGTVKRLETNAMDILNERTSNRKNYLESDMIQRWSNLEHTQDATNQAVAEFLAETGMSYADLKPEEPRTVELLNGLSDELIALMRRNSVTGAFLIFDGGAAYERPGAGTELHKAGVYFRDLDPVSTPNDNSDLMVERGSAELLRNIKLPMDINWAPTFLITWQDDGYYEPLLAAAMHEATSVNDLGYWCGPYTLNSDDTSILTYTQPLLDPDGAPYGVIGVELTADYLRTLIPSSELNPNKTAGYLLAVSSPDDEPDTYRAVTSNGPMVRRIFGDHESIRFEHEGVYTDTYLVSQESSHISDAVYASIQPFNLYNSNTPFEGQRWALIGLEEKNDLFAFSRSVSISVIVLTLACLAAGAVLAIVGGTIFTRPIRVLAKKVRLLDPAQPVNLPPVNIREIDELSASIASLSRNVSESSSRMSKIIEIAGIPLAAYQLERDASKPYYTKSFFPLIGMEEPAEGMDSAAFRALFDRLAQYIEEGDSDSDTILYKLPSQQGGYRWVRLQTVRSESGVLGVLVDVSKEITEKRRIEYERDYDLLTSLLNRRSFQARLSKLESHPEKLGIAAMVMLDLDNLKYLNDSYGHDCGDEYIRCAADVLRGFTAYGGLCARISGDEFYLFLSGYESREDLREIIFRLQEGIDSASIILPNGQPHRLRASVGIAWYPDDSTSLAELIRFSDFAMYEAKNAMKGTVKNFDMRTYERDSFLLYSREELNRLLDDAAIDYVFQPIVDCRTGTALGYEALMRPRSKALSTPAEVLRIARAQSKLLQIERLTWFKAMSSFIAMPEKSEKSLVFINSIPSQCLSPDDFHRFAEEFADYAGRIVIELTEEDELNVEATAVKQRKIKQLHMRLAIDDFGAGYSNESLLLSVKPDFVKVDMAIIRGIDLDEPRQAVFRNLAGLCHSMGIRVIAEGVETAPELQSVVRLGADYIQGYYTGKPSPHPTPIDPAVREELLRAGRELESTKV